MRLAEHVAHTVDVDGMLDSMSPEQFDEWCAKDIIEPIGNAATHHVLALIGVTIAQVNGVKDVKLEYFMPWLKPDKQAARSKHGSQSEAQMQAAMSCIPGAVTYGNPW
jgi:hypothetical protein